jgi:hypothetical protein
MFLLASVYALIYAITTVMFPLGTPFAHGTDAAVVFTGSQPVIVWRDQNRLQSAAWNGAAVPPEGTSVIATDVTSAPALAASSREALAVWIQDGHVDGIRIGGDGQPVGSVFPVAFGPATHVTVIGAAASYLVVWSDAQNTVSSILVDDLGKVVTVPATIAAGSAPVLSLTGASNGSEFLVAWGGADTQRDGVFATRVSSSGQAFGSVRLADGSFPSVAWNGHEYLIVWQGRGITGISGLRLTAEGTPLGEPLRMTTLDDGNAHVVWDGSGYVLGFARYDLFHHAMFFVVRAIRLTPEGLPAETLSDQNEAVGAGWFALAASNGRALLLRLPYDLTVSEAILGAPRKLPRRRL